MKKLHIAMLMFVMLIGLTTVGCGKFNSNNDEVDNSQNENTNENGSQEENTQAPTTDPKSFAIVVDHQLTGIELIKAAKIKNPIKAITYNIKTIIGSGEFKYETVGKVMKSGQSYRTDIEAQAEGVEVTIYNSDEKMTYKYSMDRKEGYKYQDDESAGEGPTITDEYDLTMSYIDETNLAKAEVIQYEGEPVMYFEIIEGNSRVCSWISLRYGMAIKTEMYDGETLVSQTLISNISLPASINASNFIPPTDIAFEDYTTNISEDMGLDEGLEGSELLEDVEGTQDIEAERAEDSEGSDETEGSEEIVIVE